jgi:hypothetical protein
MRKNTRKDLTKQQRKVCSKRKTKVKRDMSRSKRSTRNRLVAQRVKKKEKNNGLG